MVDVLQVIEVKSHVNSIKIHLYLSHNGMQLGFFFPTLRYLSKIRPTNQKKVKFTIEKKD